ncbi:MAG: hypothetical protein JSR66_14730 [Proteobacteria bacterium]|nr:hypothetical protein [Pseudomonadota bacterium]
MENATIREGFFKHREHESQPGSVHRSSGVFYVLQSPEVNTEFLLFNYWLHKRGINNLTLAVTLRDCSGSVVYREAGPMSFTGAHALKVAQLLERAVLAPAFEGSCEIEILSDVNLHVPYPAVIVRYHGGGWHSTAHSYSRFLAESSGDVPERIDAVQLTCEGNWTVHPDPKLETFFVIHNGATGIGSHELVFTLTNHRGERASAAIADVSYAPFETRRFFPGRHLDFGAHLQGRPGCLEVATQVAGVFPRMLCGHVRASDGALSVDHSNFNYTGRGGRQDCLPMPEGTRKPLGFVIPALAGPDWACWADFYPTWPDRSYRDTITVRTADGREAARTDIVLGADAASGPVRVPVSDLLAPHGGSGAVDFTISHATQVPTRFHMGIHYQYRGGVPAFLIDGPMPYTATGVRSRWFPVLFDTDTRTWLFISNQIFDPAAPADVVYEIAAYNARGSAPLGGRLHIAAGATVATDLRELVPGIEEFLDGEAGWVYLKADQPSLSVVHYIMQKGPDSLAVDHAF